MTRYAAVSISTHGGRYSGARRPISRRSARTDGPANGERGITKIIIEHDMEVVFSLARRITVMAQGSVIAEGEPEKIKRDARVQEAYLGGAHL